MVVSRWKHLVTEHRVLLVVALVTAVATRLYDLGAESLWLDEAITFHRSRLPLGELVEDAWKTYHNPAYFMLIHFWMKFGDSEFMLRLPSACFGVFTIAITFATARIAAGTWAGFAAAVALCVNPKILEYDQEARMYAAYCMGASIAIYGIVWLFSNPRDAAFPIWRLVRDRTTSAEHPGALRAWLAVFCGCVVALYCHGTAVLFVTACSIVALLFIAFRPERRGFLVNWTLANLLVIAAFLPWLPNLFVQSQDMDTRGFWVPEPTYARVFSAVRAVFLYGWRLPWLSALVVGFAFVGSFVLRKKPLVLAALWTFTLLCPSLLLLASLKTPIFMPRLLLWGALPFTILVGAGLAAPKPLTLRGAVLAVFFGIAGFVVIRGYYIPSTKPRWRDAVAKLSDSAKPGVRILSISRREWRLFQYYFERRTDPTEAFDYYAMEGTSADELDEAIRGARTVWTVQGQQSTMAADIRSLMKQRAKRESYVGLGEGAMMESWTIGATHKGRRRDK